MGQQIQWLRSCLQNAKAMLTAGLEASAATTKELQALEQALSQLAAEAAQSDDSTSSAGR